MSQVTVTVDTEIVETNVTVNNEVVNVLVTVSPEEAARAFALQAEAAALAAELSEDNAAASAAAASLSEQAAELAEDNAAASAGTASAQAGIATTQAGNALASANAAAVSASAALGSENAAAASASVALGSENAAAASAGIATTQAGIATTQAGNALISANNAAASASAAAQVGTSTLLTGFSVGANTAIAATDSILTAFNKTQGQINARVSGTGTAGQVAFWSGASSQTGSNNLFWDSANGRLGIGTNAPSDGLHLGVGKQIRFAGTFAGSGDLRLIENDGAISISAVNVAARFRMLPFNNDIWFQNTTSSGNINFSGNLGADLTGNVIFRTLGGVLINTTTNAGFRLDVNGTARVQGYLTIGGSNLPPASWTRSLTIGNDGTDKIISGYLASTINGAVIGSHNSALTAWSILNVVGSEVSFRRTGENQAMRIFSNGNILIQEGGTFTSVASAILAVNSQTKGFLPPRMTTAQRDAIASPATGLQIFNTTTTKTETYDGTTWQAHW
jgi:hypothetical protein